MPTSVLGKRVALIFLYVSEEEATIAKEIIKDDFQSSSDVFVQLGSPDRSLVICSFYNGLHDIEQMRKSIEVSCGGFYMQ